MPKAEGDRWPACGCAIMCGQCFVTRSSAPAPEVVDGYHLAYVKPQPDHKLAAARFDMDAAQRAVRDLLKAIGEDPNRQGLADTPKRVAKAWREFMCYDPGTLATQFESAQVDQMVVVSGMRVWSMCEHHLMPFWCDVAVGYIARGKVLGLSKMARVAHKHAHRLQLQERLVSGVADELAQLLGHDNVAVLAQGQHLCMVARGVKTPGLMTSSSLSGRFRDADARAEFMALATQAARP